MKAYELMKLAQVSPKEYKGKLFSVVDGAAIDVRGKEYKTVVVNSTSGLSDITNLYRMYVSDMTMLEEVKQPSKPVYFMTAVKAYHNGKTIKGVNTDGTALEYKHKGTYPNDMMDGMGRAISSHEIFECLWYIND